MKKNNTPALRVTYLILGGGISGLSAAYHLEKKHQTDYLVVEKNSFLGGLCASEQVQGFTFDYSGHLLHLHHPYTQKWVPQLLKNNLQKLQRRAFIYLAGHKIPFPFQANLWALPPVIKQECLAGARRAAAQPHKVPAHFEQWCLQTFGEGIYRYFMRPYNQKLWQMPLTKLTWDWCGEFVPVPPLHQIETGTRQLPRRSFGYNASFYYPKHGGCGALAEALASGVPNIWTKATLQQVDFRRKCARINGQTVYFKYLINTLPLKSFVTLCPQAPDRVRTAAKQLAHTTVQVFNFAINRRVKPFHWIYFPEPDIPFYRVGLQSAFARSNAPCGTSSFYVETAEKIANTNQAQKAFLKILVQKGIIKKQDKILFSFWREIPTAYALYDNKRATAVDCILHWLQQQNCFCAGRYGRWEYSFMERSLLQGRELARQVTEHV